MREEVQAGAIREHQVQEGQGKLLFLQRRLGPVAVRRHGHCVSQAGQELLESFPQLAIIIRQENAFSGHQCQPSAEITVS